MRICRKHFVEGKPSEDPSGVDYVLTIVNIKKGAWKMQKQLVQEQRYQKRCGQRNQPKVLASPSEVPSVGPAGVAEEK